MEHSLKALIMSASLIITCSLLSLGFRLYHESKEAAQQILARQQFLAGNAAEAELIAYDGLVVYGSTVRYMIGKLQGFSYGVGIREAQKTCWFYFDCSSTEHKIFLSSEYEHDAICSRVTDKKQYIGSVLYDSGGSVVGIVFQSKE